MMKGGANSDATRPNGRDWEEGGIHEHSTCVGARDRSRLYSRKADLRRYRYETQLGGAVSIWLSHTRSRRGRPAPQTGAAYISVLTTPGGAVTPGCAWPSTYHQFPSTAPVAPPDGSARTRRRPHGWARETCWVRRPAAQTHPGGSAGSPPRPVRSPPRRRRFR